MGHLVLKTAFKALLLVLLILPATSFSEPSAQEIMERSFAIERVDDHISSLVFYFKQADKPEKKVVYTMVWKNSRGEKGYDNKAIFYTEYPLDKKGIAYLGWLRASGSTEQDDEWIYLPELRMVRRIAHRDHDHSHDDDEFAGSVLTREHLDPRSPKLDDHKFLGVKEEKGRQYYVIESIPKKMSHQQAESHQGNHGSEAIHKRVSWIEQDSHQLHSVKFYNHHQQEILNMAINWHQIGDFWMWKQVIAIHPKTGNQTTLDIKDIVINKGLKDSQFSKRALQKGMRIFK
ncbi:MAG: outer membrane lipoprotein-sorting protein [Gammaproteobacteria bacterium]|nr:outer membrane lipoprotein-sorting protein [Gammaproteobacteria bacterium]